jgi:hypothetical protein
MSELTLRSHGSEVGQQFSWERTCERVWERTCICILHVMTLCSEVQTPYMHDWCQCHESTRPSYMNVCLILLILTRCSEVGHDDFKK